jgi:hypothetical protein
MEDLMECVVLPNKIILVRMVHIIFIHVQTAPDQEKFGLFPCLDKVIVKDTFTERPASGVTFHSKWGLKYISRLQVSDCSLSAI